MNGADHHGAGLRAAVREAIAADDLEDTVRAVLERRFPAEGRGAPASTRRAPPSA